MNQLYIYIYPHISSLLHLPPSHPPYPTPLGGHKAPSWSPLLCGCFPLAIYFTFGSVYMSMPLSHFVPAYPCPSPYPQVHSLVGLCLYSCLAPRSFVTFFFFLDSIYMYYGIQIQYLFFSFWLTSLCMTDSRSIHLTTNNSISFLFMAE